MQGKEHDGLQNGMLTGWQAIADHFARNQSTVRRWAETRALPVHRAAADKGGSVYAYRHELDAWLTRGKSVRNAAASNATSAPDPDQGSQPDERSPDGTGSAIHASASGAFSGEADLQAGLWRSVSSGTRWAAALAIAAVLGLLAILYTSGPAGTANSASRLPPTLPENVVALYNDAGYLWPKRTRESLLEAEDLLNQVVDLAPDFASAQADLATVYNLMVEYHVKPAEEGYALSLAAARRAIEIDPGQASALTVLGDLSYYWQKRYEDAFGYFRQAVEADPQNAQTRQWYASALMTSGRFAEAEVQIRRARELEPQSRSIIVSEAMIQLGRGDATRAREALLHLLANETNYRNPYRFLLFADLAERDFPAYIQAMHDWFDLIGSPSGSVLADAAETAWRSGGQVAMIEAMADVARQQEMRDSLEQYFRAHVLALAGDWQAALEQLERTPTRQAFYYSIDPAFEQARKDPDFLRQMSELGFPVVPLTGA